jgi:hypothetical protein
MFGTQIRNCVIQANILGLHLANSSATVPAIIEKNLFYNNNVVGNNYGRAIYSDGGISGGTLQNVLITNNAFLRNRGAGNIQPAIGLEAQNAVSIQTNITISNNYFDTNGKALLAYNASNITFSGNTVGFCWDTTSASLRFEGGTSNITITGNTLHNSEARAIRIDKKAFSADNSAFTITGNNIFGNGQGVGQDDVNHDGLYIDAGMYTGTLNATNNWWGNASGPGGDGAGTGDKVFAHGNSVNFSGWATAPFQPLQKPYKGVAWSPLYRIEAEDFDHGNADLAYNDTTAQNLDMFYRDYESPDLEPTTDVDGGAELYEIRSNEFLAYTIQVDQPGIYSGSFRVNTAQTSAARFHLEMSNASGGFDVISSAYTITNTANAWQTQTLNNINFASYGTKVLRIVFESGGSGTVSTRLNWFKFNLVTPTGPFAPSGLSAVPNGANINLSWTDTNTNETGTVIEKQIGSGPFTTIATLAPNVTTYSDAAGYEAGQSITYRLHATTAAGDSPPATISLITPATQAVTYLGGNWTSMSNGWGPVEIDHSVGSSNAGDGGIITLNGVQYSKGLGAHATSDIVYTLTPGQNWIFTSDVGIDDATGGGTAGEVSFRVFLNGSATPTWDSGPMTGVTATKTVTLNLTGVATLRLYVDPGANTVSDWADWAGARLIAADSAIPTIYSGSAAADSYAVRAVATDPTILEVLQAGAVFWRALKSQIPNLKFNASAGDDTLTVDYGSGTPIPTGGLFFDGGGGTADTLVITGGSSNDAATVANAFAGPTSGSININDATTGVATVEGITFTGGAGNDTLTIASGPAAPVNYNGGLTPTDQDTLNLNAGAYTFSSDLNTGTANLSLSVNNPGTSVSFVSTQHLAALSIANAQVIMTADGTRLINTATLNVTGTGILDLKDNDMVITAGSVGSWNGSNYTGITGLLKKGYNAGSWTGTGSIITSQTAATSSRNRTHLAVAKASDIINFGAATTATWQGQTVSPTSVLIKYTYIGDTDLSGTLSGDDYFRIDNGFAAAAGGYVNGDYDFNFFIDADDYFWLDNSYASHGGSL